MKDDWWLMMTWGSNLFSAPNLFVFHQSIWGVRELLHPTSPSGKGWRTGSAPGWEDLIQAGLISTQKDFEPNFYHADRSWQAETCKLASSRKLQRASSQGTWLTWMPMKWVRQHDLGTPNQMKPHYPFPIIIMQCSVWKEGERLYYYP